MSENKWRFRSHMALATQHITMDEHEPTGILCESHALYRNGQPTSRVNVYYWHPTMPKKMTCQTFEEVKEWLQQSRETSE